MMTTAEYLALGGNAYWHKVRGRSGRVVELWPYHAGNILPVPGGDTWIERYDFYEASGVKKPIPAEDIVHFKWPSIDPLQPWMAQPPLMAAAKDVDTDNEITRYLFALLKNDAIPRTVVTVFIPEYVVGHWWEQLLHNQSALRLKTRLLFMNNVMVTSVPWQLTSSERVHELAEHNAPGDVRRGFLE